MTNSETGPALIETIYASTVLSRSIDSIIGDLEGQVLDLLKAIAANPAKSLAAPEIALLLLPPEVERHVAMARHIQSAFGAGLSGQGWLGEVLERIASPALAFDATGAILLMNGAARRAGWEGKSLAHLGGGASQADAIHQAAVAIPEADDISAAPIKLKPAGKATQAAVVKRAGARAADAWGGPVWILMLADLAIDDTLVAQARAVFGLTEAEALVAVRFVQGVSLDEIAASRRVSLETIRAQIKSIKAKTGARDLQILMRLLCALAYGIYAPEGSAAAAGQPSAAAPWTDTMRLRDGRRLDYLRQGAARGAPVLVLHTLGYGSQLTAVAHRYADAKGLSIISPLRAGHAYSDPAPEGDAQALFDQAADDMAALLDHLGIVRVRIIGHAAGAAHAIRFASRYPKRVDAIVMVCRGPVWRNEWLNEISPNHRAFALVLRHLPGAARLIIGAILQHFNKHGSRGFLVNAAQESPPDVAALADPDVLHLIGHGVTFGLRQGPEVYCREFAQMQLDLTEEARALACPLTLIYGAQDRIASPAFARRFADAVPQTRLIELADAGHYLFYSHWRAMLDAAADAG